MTRPDSRRGTAVKLTNKSSLSIACSLPTFILLVYDTECRKTRGVVRVTNYASLRFYDCNLDSYRMKFIWSLFYLNVLEFLYIDFYIQLCRYVPNLTKKCRYFFVIFNWYLNIIRLLCVCKLNIMYVNGNRFFKHSSRESWAWQRLCKTCT